MDCQTNKCVDCTRMPTKRGVESSTLVLYVDKGKMPQASIEYTSQSQGSCLSIIAGVRRRGAVSHTANECTTIHAQENWHFKVKWCFRPATATWRVPVISTSKLLRRPCESPYHSVYLASQQQHSCIAILKSQLTCIPTWSPRH